MLSASLLQKIREEINNTPQLRGCRIGYYGNAQCGMVDAGNSGSANYHKVVVIEEREVLENRFTGSTIEIKKDLTPEQNSNESPFWKEAWGAGLSCGLAVASFSGATAGAAAIIPTGGTSAIITVALWTGFTMQSLQCLNGIARTINSNSLQQWDNNSIYKKIVSIIDIIGLGAGVVTIVPAAAQIFRLLRIKGSLPSKQTFDMMTKNEKVKAYEEAVRRIGSNPADKLEYERLLKEVISRKANRLGKMNATIIKDHAGTVSERTMKKLVDTVQKHVSNQKDFYTGAGINAMPEEWVGSASGTLNAAPQMIGQGIDYITTTKKNKIFINILVE